METQENQGPVGLADAPELAARAEAETAPKAPAYFAYCIRPLGKDNLYELQEIQMTDSGGGVMTGRVIRRSVPNTRDICTGRAISCLEGIDGFGYGEHA